MKAATRHIPLVSVRLVRERSVPYHAGRKLTCAEEVHALFRDLAEDLDREAVWVVCLATNGRPVCLSQISLGTLNATQLNPREVLKTALLANARSLILVHNHPSGDPAPSAEDRAATARVRAAAEVMDVTLLDHLIIGDGCYYSFREAGEM